MRYWIMLLVLMMTGWTAGVKADNIYKINDELYGYYVRAYKMRQYQEGLAIADTMLRKAEKMGDKKAECIALVIPVNYHFYRKNDLKGMLKAVNTLKARSEKNGYMQYYFFAGNQLINFYVNTNRYSEATIEISNQRKKAMAIKDHFGIMSAYKNMGRLYLSKSEFYLAWEELKTAIEYAETHDTKQNTPSLYTDAAQALNAMGQRDKALEYAHKGFDKATSNMAKGEALSQILLTYFYSNRFDDFERLYNGEYQKYRNAIAKGNNVAYRVDISHNILIGNDDIALGLIDSLEAESSKLLYKSAMMAHKGDYKMAYEYNKRAHQVSDSVRSILNYNDLAMMAGMLKNEELKSENQLMELYNSQLSLANAQLSLDNANLETTKAKDMAQMERMNTEFLKLKMANADYAASQLQDSLEINKARIREAELKHSRNRMAVGGMALVMIILIVGFISYIIYRNRMMERIKNADKMKTVFLQNMSHEVRTPLNAIAGFSNLLVTMGDELTAEERTDMAQRVTDNTALLVNLIDDILDISKLETGEYKMVMEESKVNDICRMAMSAVEHRRKHNVEMKWSSDVDDSYTIFTDKSRVEQVIINMLTNAIKNTEEGAITLNVNIDMARNTALFAVSDTGVGIAPENAEKIFERFKKLDTFKQGTGLGLNICRLIAERLGGSICLDTSYRSGARFVFSIPISAK